MGEISFAMEIMQTFWMVKLKKRHYTKFGIHISALGAFNVLLHLCVLTSRA